jgi:hypothetical protein
MTEGRRLLLRVLTVTTAWHVACRCRVTVSAVKNWAAGYNCPNSRARRALAHSYGIPPESWRTYTIRPL